MDVGDFLRRLGLERYEPSFRENQIDADILPRLTSEDLKELGVRSVGHRRRILDAVAVLPPAKPPAHHPGNGRPGAETGPSEGDRRHVAVMFADLSDFTGLSRRLDAEEVHELLDRFFDVVDRTVVAHGGSIDKHIGDCAMAVFGAPVAHDNDQERAVHAALAVRAAVAALEGRWATDIGVHIGIACGSVVASASGSARHRSYTVIGEAVNLAARLTDRAETGEILISDAMYRSVENRMECAASEPFTADGYAGPITAWKVLGPRMQPRPEHRPFVGRHEERDRLRRVLVACRESGHGSVVVVRGEPGIGKTRLVEEVQQEATTAGFGVHVAQVLDFGGGSGNDAIRSILRSLLGLRADDDRRVVRAIVRRAFQTAVLVPERRVHLNALLGLRQPKALRSIHDAMDDARRREGQNRTLVELIQYESARRPLLIVVEDVHWADEATSDHLRAIASGVADCAAVLLMTSRRKAALLASSDEGVVGWPVIDIGPLNEADAMALAGAIGAASERMSRLCIERAAGNPLFLEQLLQHGESPMSDVPDSVQHLVQARMDRLDPVDRLALQAASVFGQRFPLAGLRFVLRSQSYRCDRLVSRVLVRPLGPDFQFVHALVRDAVHASLLRGRRRVLHRRAAEWYASRDPVLRAEHLDLAEDPRAAEACLAAARTQADVHRYAQALALVERGMRSARGSVAFDLALSRAELLLDLGRVGDAREAFGFAADAARTPGESCRAHIGLATVKRMVDEIDGALEDLSVAETLAEELDLLADLARIHYLRGNLLFPRGDIEGCLREHTASLDCARRSEARDLEAAALGGLGDAEYVRGRMLTAHARFEACVALCQLHGFGRIEVAYSPMLAIVLFFVGKMNESLELALDSEVATARVGHQRARIIAHHACHLCYFAMARPDAAWPHVNGALDLSIRLGSRRFEAESLVFRAELKRLEGDRTGALRDLEQAIDLCRKTGMAYIGPLALGALALTTPDAAVRNAALAEGMRWLEAGAACHNHFMFHRDAINACLNAGDWDGAERHAEALRDYTREEPLATIDLIIARGHALAAWGRGRRDAGIRDEILRLRTLLEGMGMIEAAHDLVRLSQHWRLSQNRGRGSV